jgi:hypothetical protein
MKEFNNYLQAAKSIHKDTLQNYEYVYYNKTPNGMEYNNDVNEYFGNTREGYEKFRQENPDSFVDYATTSLRPVRDNVTKNVIGYITEKTLSCTPMRDEAKKLYKLQLQEVIDYLEVKDINSFMFYVDTNSENGSFGNDTSLYISKISYLVDLIEEYEEDEEFKSFIDKIKG